MMIGPLMLDIAGTSLSDEDIVLLQNPRVGGVILFARNISGVHQVQQLTQHIRQINPNILIAVDQEGGRVQRLKTGFSKLPPMRHLGYLFEENESLALEYAEYMGWLMATEVLAVGIDFSFAPVLDLDSVSTVIGDRGFHCQPQHVITLSRAFMQGMHRAGMATTGKHFPGHGSVEQDSHIALPVDTRCFEDIATSDLYVFKETLPFLNAIMPAHVIYSACDADAAGFSTFWLNTILREQLHFEGCVFSDDLSMEGASSAGSMAERVLKALDAGCDMVLVCNNRPAAIEALSALENVPLQHSTRLQAMRGKTTSLSNVPSEPIEHVQQLLSPSTVMHAEWQRVHLLAEALHGQYRNAEGKTIDPTEGYLSQRT